MEKKRNFAVILSGCGVYDGAEIHEAVMTLYAISKNGGEYEIFAPDIQQHHVVNHITGEEMNETRNVLVESARIARGAVKPLDQFDYKRFDALIFPGGFGAAKNLSDFAFKGDNLTVNPDIERVVKDMVNNSKPVGALCIAPVLLAKIINQPVLTIGQDKATESALINLGAQHKKTDHGEIVTDEKYKLVSSPCYMLDANLVNIAEGAEAVVKELLRLID